MADDVETIIAELFGEADRAVKLVALEVTASLIEATPVDTGNLRASWVPNIGGPFEGVPSTRDAVSTAAQEAGTAAVATGYRIDLGEVWITNGASYAVEVDARQGFSPPIPFAIEEAVAAASAKLEHDR